MRTVGLLLPEEEFEHLQGTQVGEELLEQAVSMHKGGTRKQRTRPCSSRRNLTLTESLSGAAPGERMVEVT